ncbi:Zn-ribbon domain-containing OB-fold protein [Nocardia transvalensis]|uniref:Zn-ribbon domain-containing OB-fold protein n=1 Tax=Nocardia transvalensis TaxID=37333 RepID=UPI00189570F6|nr:OB-fold domain-containing protein [Nocardia transvalensis]MBF6331160.1 OB-fold domain-containing protein [Nocardia transvalensis]
MTVPEDEVTAAWWDGTRHRRLLLQHCTKCEALQHYPRAVCTECGSTALDWVTAGGGATVESFTVVHRQVRSDLPAPYVVARVRLDEGPTLLTNLIGGEPDSWCCDDRVRLTWRSLDDGRRLPIFEREPDGFRSER